MQQQPNPKGPPPPGAASAEKTSSHVIVTRISAPPLVEDKFKGRMVASSIAQYKILDKIGSGGMGVVYQAERLDTHELVAMKFLSQDAATAHTEMVARFKQEATTMSKIKHPNVVQLLDFGVDTHMFLVMEYLEGQSLGNVLSSGGLLPWKRIKNIMLQTCDGLAAAHAQKVYHRDIKPDNIFLTEGDRVKLLDFGTAKEDSTTAVTLTQTGQAVGTLLYMPPEAFEDTKFPGEPKSRLLIAREVYSTGAVLYHVLAGIQPFFAEEVPALMKQILIMPVIPLSERVPLRGIPPELDGIVMQALAKSPFDRYNSILELRNAISQVNWSGRRKKLWHGSGMKRSFGRFMLKASITLAVGLGIAWGILHPEQLRSFFNGIQCDTYSFYNNAIRPPLVRHNFMAPKLTLPERQYAVSITCNVDAKVYLDTAGKLKYLDTTPFTHTFRGEGQHALIIKSGGQSQRVYVSPKKTDVAVHFVETRKSQEQPVGADDSLESR